MLVIAITGGIACGKSSVSRLLSNALPDGRLVTFDSDACVADLLEEAESLERIQQIIGVKKRDIVFPDGILDKPALRKETFDNSDFREKLEAVLHPRVLDRANRFCEASRPRADLALIEVPLLYEVDFPLERDLDLVVAASQMTQQLRLQSDRGLAPETAGQIIAAQLPIEQKIIHGDVVVWNDGQHEILEDQVNHLVKRCHHLFN